MNRAALAIHGGAGTIERSSMTAALELEYRGGLENALRIGWAILEKGGGSLDTVEATVAALEDFPLFNAGRGSVFTHEGKIEMDAAIMDGKSLKAGAVAFVRNVKNPVKLARLVMDRTEHVLLAGDGAMQFAEQMNVELADDAYFFTDNRWLQLQQAKEVGRVQLDHHRSEPQAAANGCQYDVEPEPRQINSVTTTGIPESKIDNPKPLGTVGAVACDMNGNLAAATSTGGMTNKRFGRVGDTAIIGAGTYADETCAISCTGHGEYFMRGVSAYDVTARVKYKGLGLIAAASQTIENLTAIGGEGGLIAVDAIGNVVLPFNSAGMYRGSISADGGIVVNIYK
ncbi:MAG: isoaspartyl peptidase/L-asparaginase [Pyrinomonadaceae bacterium]